ncbi:hypothetical protein QE152_g14416 [Popillia japonica]|uniref:Copia protein n=1 Tax=Popillia japonica TaxID=7064 RepID=A0AAW1L9F6_POPJA
MIAALSVGNLADVPQTYAEAADDVGWCKAIEEELKSLKENSDFANSIVDRKSITGFVIKLNNNVIHWKTKRQNNVLSSAESKYVALATCVTENLFLAQILAEIANFNVYPITVFEDNQSCIKMASTFESKRSKHINIKHHFVRECVTQNKIKLLYINSNKQQADMFTKQLAATKFKYFRDSLNVTLLNEKES